jgi:sialate O-acetylesterase
MPTLCALLLTLTPLAAQQPAPANNDPSPSPPEYHGAPAGARGPVLSTPEIAQGAMLLHFTHADGGLLLKGSGRGAFELAGVDHIWFPAEAHLVNGVVVVSTSLVPQPTAVRYTWSSLAAATLFNNAGLPAAPFRTDK